MTTTLTNIPTFASPTGLLTRDSEFIYGTFVRSRQPNFRGEYHNKWIFLTDDHNEPVWTVSPIANLKPRKYTHFSLFEDLVYNPEIQLSINAGHMLDPGPSHNRIQEVLPRLDSETDAAYHKRLREKLKEAVEHMKTRVQVNYRTVVPQIYNNDLQLLVPLSFDGGDSTPLVIPVTKRESNNPECTDTNEPAYWEYKGDTVLTTAMAYNNARLLCKVESEWLHSDVQDAAGAGAGAGVPTSGARAGWPAAGGGAGARVPNMQSLLEMIDVLKPAMSQDEKGAVSSRMYAP